MKHLFLLLIAVFFTEHIFAQQICGKTLSNKSKTAISYVNIGIANKNIGTVSDNNGNFCLEIDSQYDNDTITFSCIGYYSLNIEVADFKTLTNTNVILNEKTFDLDEIVIKPKERISKTLGVKTKSKVMAAGFEENKLGYECGLLMRIKKSAVIERLHLNIASCSYDTIYYRVNVYEVDDNKGLVNILTQPIYFEFSKDEIGGKIDLDLKKYKIYVERNFVVTVEHVKDLGEGHLLFGAGLSKKTHFRRTSQGAWETVPVGIGLSVDILTEK